MVLTPQQEQQWGDTMSLMAWTCPGFRHLFYKLLSNNDGKYGAVLTRSVPVAATDGKNILINPDKFFEHSLQERTFIVAHEIVHNVYGDVEFLHRCVAADNVPMDDGTTMPFDMEIMQKALDYRINPLLADSKIGKCPEGACLDDNIGKANDSRNEVYKRLYESDPPTKNKGKGFDIVLRPGTSTGQSPQQAGRNPQQWAVEVSAAQTLEAIRSQGKMAGALKRMFQDILDPQIPWTDHIQSIFNRKVGSGSYTWKRPDRRFLMRDIILPGRSGKGAGWIAIWGDTSGSISPTELNKYMAELGSIIEDVRPRRITVLWCDAAIHHIDEIEEAVDLQTIMARGVGGGGGTSVQPVFKWIQDQLEVPDMFIGFTDGYVTFPSHEPAFPVIWASIADTKYPWGEVVRIK